MNKPPAFAGTFYPENQDELINLLREKAIIGTTKK